MKQLMSIAISLLFVFNLLIAAEVAETQAQSHMDDDDHMNDYPWDDGDHMNDFPWDDMPGLFHNEHHGGNFKISDLTGDDIPEIIILKNETLTILDNAGNPSFSKTVEGIDDRHEGWMFMPGHNHQNGEVGLDVADMDGDGIPEIVILDTQKLIVLDNEGNPKTNIPLP
jgi:archaellum component FlaG (FlaF/FlaG flagellin family)